MIERGNDSRAVPSDGDGSVPGDELGAFVPGPRTTVAGAPGGPLAGTRFGAKDLFDVAGTRTGAGNPDFLADAPVAREHASAVAALLTAGSDLAGKTITDELAFSLSGTNAHYGTPRNPAAPRRVPGGSSSGSASAVAGGAVELALGTDTGGSIRVPASYCGIFGLRPTHGRIRSDGVVPLAPSLDTVGLLAADGHLLAAAWAGLASAAGTHGTGTSAAAGAKARAVAALVCPPELFALLDDAARTELETSADELGRLLGCRVVERSILPPAELERIRETFKVVQLAEAWASHGAWVERRRPRFGPGVASRFAAASRTAPDAVELLGPARLELRRVLSQALGDDALLVQPAASGPAHVLDLAGPAKDETRLRTLTLTALGGVAGAPVVALPMAQLEGMPLGLAVVALPGEDELLVECASRVSFALER